MKSDRLPRVLRRHVMCACSVAQSGSTCPSARRCFGSCTKTSSRDAPWRRCSPAGPRRSSIESAGARCACARRAGTARLIVASAPAVAAPGFDPPPTPARPVVDLVHGVQLTDPYRWLEDGNDPEVQAWTKRQHQATRSWLDCNAPPVAGLHDE